MHDCVIVGAGLSGMLVARELSQSGMRVAVLDRNGAGREASWAGGGILSPLHPWRYPAAVTALSQWGHRHWPHLATSLHRETGIDPEWTPSGLLMPEIEERSAAETWARDYQVRLELIDREAMRTREPNLGNVGDAALWMPDVAQVRNPRLVRALRADLVARGVALMEGTDVHGWVCRAGRVVGVQTDQDVVAGGCVVVAVGAWTGQLMGKGGVPLPVDPVRGQMLVFRTAPGLVSTVVLRRNNYLIPRRDGHLVVGSTVERVGFDKSTTDQACDGLRRAAIELVPAVADYPVERHWAGLRPGSPDGVPYIGQVQGVAGLFVNAGHFRNGVILGPASARLLSDLVLQRPPILDPAPYAPPAQSAG